MRERFAWMLAIVLQGEDRIEKDIHVEENSCCCLVAILGCRLGEVGKVGQEYGGFEMVS